MQIRITDTPPGEAPDWVRKAWVGLTLPLARGQDGLKTTRTHGVLTGPKTMLGQLFAFLMGNFEVRSGYVVEAQAAFDILVTANPDAAEWWRSQCPELNQPDRNFMFAAEVCEEVLE